MRHPAFTQLVTGVWDGDRGINHTLYAIDVEGEVWKLYSGRWVVCDAPRDSSSGPVKEGARP